MVNQDGEKMRFYSNLLQGKLDPAGNKLLYVMPRYQMSKEDLDDLVVYLKRLGTDVGFRPLVQSVSCLLRPET